jgi:hypothetical protein
MGHAHKEVRALTAGVCHPFTLLSMGRAGEGPSADGIRHTHKIGGTA